MRSSDRIERDAVKELGIFLVIHMDPVEMKDKRVLKIRDKTVQLLHDLGILRVRSTISGWYTGEHKTNLIFDMVVSLSIMMRKRKMNFPYS